MILLNRSYNGYPSGSIVQFQTPLETSLVQQGLATVSVGPVTPGNVSTTEMQGRAGIAAAGTNVVISNPSFTAEAKFNAFLSNAAADTTALYVTRIVPAVGQVTIYVNAAATAATSVDWMCLMNSGELQTP